MWDNLKELFIGGIKHNYPELGTNFESWDDGTSVRVNVKSRPFSHFGKVKQSNVKYIMETKRYMIGDGFSVISVKTIRGLTNGEKRDAIGHWRQIMNESE